MRIGCVDAALWFQKTWIFMLVFSSYSPTFQDPCNSKEELIKQLTLKFKQSKRNSNGTYEEVATG